MHSIDTPASRLAAFERPRGRTGDGAKMLGQMGAEQLEVEIEASLLADAAEEISLHHSERAESKHVAERKKELARPRSLMSSQEIESYIDDAEDGEEGEGSSKLVVLVQRVMSGQGDPGVHARQVFLRPTSQYLGLQYTLQHGEREGASEQTLEALREALDDLEMEHGPRIRADINIIAVAAEGKPGASAVEEFQSTYVDLVLGDSSLTGTLKLVLNQYGETGLAQGMERLQRALGRDLAAARPSADPTRLQSLVQDLYHLGVASTVLEGCRDLLALMQSRHGNPMKAGAPVELMSNLVDLSSETWVSSTRFTQLAEKSGAQQEGAQINFLTGIKVLMRDMPPQIFVDRDQRDGVLKAAQEALDIAIDREEE